MSLLLARHGLMAPLALTGGYIPVAEPAPNEDMLTEYDTATETTHDWADLTGFNTAGVQVSGGYLYGISGANPSAAMLPFSVGPTETVRLTCEIEIVSGSSASVYVGFSTATSPSASMPGSILGGTAGSITNYAGAGISTATRYTTGGGGTPTGLVTVTAVATPETISICIRKGDNTIEGNVVYNRSAMPTIASLVFWNFDSRGLSGHNIRAFGVKRSLTPFRTKSVSGQTFEGNSGQVMHIGSSANDTIRIHVPKGADSDVLPICLVCHAVSHTAASSIDDVRYRPVVTALENAGYLVVSPSDGASSFRWGNATSIAKHLEAVDYVRDRMYAGGMVVLTVSGGTVVGHNLITRREIHVRGIYSVCGVLDSPEFYNDQPSFQSAMNTAFGATDLASFTTNSVGFVPTDEAAGGDAVEYTGKRARFSVTTSDATVNNAKHTTVMQGLVAPYAAESGIVSVSGGHLDIAAFNTTDIVDFFGRCF
jgi:hypothetical protein